jgi:hypothetical protein
MALRLLLAAAVVAGCAVALSGATDHIVGDRTYTIWSGNHTFFIGDLICKPPPLHFFWLMRKLHQIDLLLSFAISHIRHQHFSSTCLHVQRSGTRRGRTACSR